MRHMMLGQFEKAWQVSDQIEASRRASQDAEFVPVWDGSGFEGKRILVRCVHGFGDAIQFIRYAPLLRRRGERVMAQTHPELVPLLQGVPGLDEVFTWGTGASKPEYDQQIEVMELPYAFRSTVETLPSEVPYIRVSPDRVESRGVRFSTSRMKAGLVWASSKWDPNRSVPLQALLPLGLVPGVKLFSLQHGPEHVQLFEVSGNGAITHWGEQSSEILDTAADICNLDLIITVDTMVAHLAGALAKPVWTLLPFTADWRWMANRDDSPWYPTMRLFRQPAPGDWETPIRRVEQELFALARSQSSSAGGPAPLFFEHRLKGRRQDRQRYCSLELVTQTTCLDNEL